LKSNETRGREEGGGFTGEGGGTRNRPEEISRLWFLSLEEAVVED